MLKRTTGRFLITLLVITGLAGTVNDNTLSKTERKYAMSLMKDTYKGAIAATKTFLRHSLILKQRLINGR